MSDSHVLHVSNRHWVFADSKTEFRFNFRLWYHVLYSVTLASF